MASPVKKLRPGPEAGAEVSAKQEGDTWTGRVKNSAPGGVLLPAPVSHVLTLTAPYTWPLLHS